MCRVSPKLQTVFPIFLIIIFFVFLQTEWSNCGAALTIIDAIQTAVNEVFAFSRLGLDRRCTYFSVQFYTDW